VTVQTAAIVGLHWGLVHLRGLREAGCEVVALAARDGAAAASVAAREGVPRGTADVASLNGMDLVVIATPAATHADLIGALPQPHLICEKPLLGLTGARVDLPAAEGRMYVNYAFGFLATARAIDAVADERGAPDRIALDVSVQLPLDLSAEQWFLEALSHPLSWLLLRHGPPSVSGRTVAPDTVSVDLRAGDVPMRARLQLGGEPGIHQRVAMQWGRNVLMMRGRYRPEQPWTYDPVLVNGSPINGGESSPSDCWLDANAASVRAMVERFRGDTAPAPLFDAGAALMVEDALLGPIRADG
jgi:hypothetical protein